jgi:large subunit ribosomal protein L23
MSILKKPIISEKATAKSEKLSQYTFKVDVNADKAAIKAVVEKMYGVKVKGVSTMRYAGKKMVRFTTKGVNSGRKPSFKKAIVTLKEGQTINFFESV